MDYQIIPSPSTQIMYTTNRMAVITLIAILVLLLLMHDGGIAMAAMTDGGVTVITRIGELSWAETAVWIVVGFGALLLFAIGEFLFFLRTLDQG